MAALLIIPFLEALGVTEVLTLGAEVVVGEAYAGTAGTIGTGLIAGEIAAPVNKKAEDYYKDHYEGTFTDYFNDVKAVLTYDTGHFINKQHEKEKKEQQEVIHPSGASPITVRIPTRFSPQNPITDRPTVRIPPSLGAPSSHPMLVTDKITTSDVILPPKTVNNTKINVQTTQSQKALQSLDRYDFFDTSPRALARFVIDTSRRLTTTKNLREATYETLELEPEVYTLSQKVGRFMANKSLPNTEEFQRIKAVYNGRSINKNSFSESVNPTTGLIEVTGTNELGQIQVLPQTTGFTLPSVAGTIFMGPNSKNNRVPMGCRPNEIERVEDYFSFFHDYSWRNGSFSKVGDLQFISRLSQNMDRVRPENRKLVQATIVYFANISLNLSMFVQQPDDDIFSVLGGVQKSDPNYNNLKGQFYTVLGQELTSYTKTDGFFQSYNNTLKQETINNMLIQLN